MSPQRVFSPPPCRGSQHDRWTHLHTNHNRVQVCRLEQGTTWPAWRLTAVTLLSMISFKDTGCLCKWRRCTWGWLLCTWGETTWHTKRVGTDRINHLYAVGQHPLLRVSRNWHSVRRVCGWRRGLHEDPRSFFSELSSVLTFQCPAVRPNRSRDAVKLCNKKNVTTLVSGRRQWMKLDIDGSSCSYWRLFPLVVNFAYSKTGFIVFLFYPVFDCIGHFILWIFLIILYKIYGTPITHVGSTYTLFFSLLIE